MLKQKISNLFIKKQPAPQSTGEVARFLREASAAEQKKVFMKAIDGSIKKQQEIIKRAEAMQ